jgi:hypothetical protein
MANPPPVDAEAFDADSYTQHRLSHATPDHLHITSRRCFIGPIPKGWLNSHRKEWYRNHLHINYSSRTATFAAGDNVSQHRSVTVLDGQRVRQSFPQPEELNEEPEESQDGEEEATPTSTSAVQIPSISNVDGNNSRAMPTISNEEDVIDVAVPLSRAESEEEEASTPKPAGPDRNGGLLIPPAHTSRKAGARMSPREFGSPEDNAKSERSVYVDAPEIPTSSPEPQQLPVRMSTTSSHNGALSSNGSISTGDDTSTSLLITHAAKTGAEQEVGVATEQEPDAQLQIIQSSPIDGASGDNGESLLPQRRKSGHVNFDFADESRRADFKARVNQLDFKRPLRRVLRRRTELEGRIVKMERMLVRIDITKQQKLPDDYDENSSEGVITQTLEKWREFMVVCRQASKAEGSDFVLQIYKTRVSLSF